jgi:hypothetical protein
MIEVAATDEFVAWYDTLTTDEALAIQHVVNHLEIQGASVGFPYSIGQVGKNVQLREIRLTVHGRALRICFAIDSQSRLALMINGDRTTEEGVCSPYAEHAEALWGEYVSSRLNGNGKHG